MVVTLSLLSVGVLLLNPPRLIAMFDSGVPGSPESYAALQFAQDAGIDAVINYSLINADTKSIEEYLQYADKIGRKVVPSLKDFATEINTDPVNSGYHDQYGSSNGERVINMVRSLEAMKGHGAIWGYLYADEPVINHDIPFNAGDVANLVKPRYEQIKAVTDKPVLLAHWRMPLPDLQTLATVSDHLMMDYYPYPEGENQTYGTLDAIESIAGDIKAAAGNSSWFALQAFSYYLSEPDKIQRFTFPPQPPDTNQGAPDADVMVDMANRALKGCVRHLAFFSYGYALQVGEHQLNNIKLAVKEIRALPEFINPSCS